VKPNMSKNGFSVLDMADEYAKENEIDVSELFKKPEPVIEPEKPVSSESVKKGKWTPDATLLEGMDELTIEPLTYSKDEIKVEEPSVLRDIKNDNVIDESKGSLDEFQRKNIHIEECKARFGIRKLQIPPGQFHVIIHSAAGDTNSQRARANLDEIFTDIVTNYPEFVLEWEDGYGPKDKSKQINDIKSSTDIIDIKEIKPIESNVVIDDDRSDIETKVIINKKDLSTIAWDQTDIDKIKRSRSIELNIVEDLTLKYNNLEDADENAIDIVLSEYVRKVNDVPAALPASKYRCTFTGLSYQEVIDLSHSQELNSLDGERKKWSIVYSHLKNPSIGAFSDFEDFLKKTSFMDLEFSLWKILCATSMDKELISIDCHANYNGTTCGKSYDWIYSPAELIDMTDINPAVLEEMEKTSIASSKEDIMKNYNESMLNLNNTIELTVSGFGLIFGHISAYEFLNNIYSDLKEAEEHQDDPSSASRMYSAYALTAVKGFILPKGDGSYFKVTGANNIKKVLSQLDKVDGQVITEIIEMMQTPYRFSFSLKDIHCPQCKNKSSIPIPDMSRLLFIVAQSLSSVQVTLKKI
jgi:hypothetical protein